MQLNEPMPVLPLRTSRLSLRLAGVDDAAVIAAYRADPEVARFQDWDLPYSIERATTMLAKQADRTDVTPGEWVQVAIEHDGVVVGDVAVGLDASASVATIGYTLPTASQGHGYASEAVSAVIDALFDRLDVHRIEATMDPANFASMRVVEPLGFVKEARTRRSELIRGEWVDDLRFALLRSDHEAWRARPTTPPATVELVEVTTDVLNDVTGLATFTFQEQFVAPMARSIAQAWVPPHYGGHPVLPWYRAVRADGEIVGFVMLSAVTEWEPEPYLWRFLVDRRHQRRRIGERVIAQLVELARADGHTSMMVSWVDQPGGPRPFYERLGFVPIGTNDEGETEGRLTFG